MIEELIAHFQTMTPVLVMVAGLTIGLQHAFEADHVAAVATQVSKIKSSEYLSTSQRLRKNIFKSSLLGVFWGAGHTTTLVLVGLLIFGLSINIPKTVFTYLEFAVGIMLVFLGSMTYLNKSIFKSRHVHPHTHDDGTIHIHPHMHEKEHKHGHKSYVIGCIHGLAGSGSLVILVASSLGSVELILPFILIFGIGSIFGMTIMSGLIGLPFAYTANITKVNRALSYVAGSVSLLIGINIIYQTALVGKMFGI